ncbi:ABC transporter substrate-binding protein [Bradyrhizobium sp. STM 3557]|uniref:ABC transporter substrate-binding protein n=1 Tax=Bradyrhizobium sp. STM 3557 TaxID=578920 RepID=UPI0038910E9A
MRMQRFLVRLSLLLIGLAALTGFGARADDGLPIAIRLVLERPLDGSMAPLVLADSRGLFNAEGVTVATTSAKGPADAIARVASGEADLALADINELVRFHGEPGKPAVKAVFVLFNSAPYAIVARRSRDIHTLADLDGKTVGVAEGDLSIRLWPAVARHNAIKTAELKFAKVGAAVREPILSAGQVDAVTGFSYLSAVNLRDRGVPASDLAVLNFSDYGCEAYGLAVIASPAFAAAHPEALRGFVRALIGGLHRSISDPAAAAAAVVSRMDDGSPELELERLKTVLANNILTPEVRRNGIGGIDPLRMERAIDQIGEDQKFHRRPAAADIFDDSFLPPVDGRLIN